MHKAFKISSLQGTVFSLAYFARKTALAAQKRAKNRQIGICASRDRGTEAYKDFSMMKRGRAFTSA